MIIRAAIAKSALPSQLRLVLFAVVIVVVVVELHKHKHTRESQNSGVHGTTSISTENGFRYGIQQMSRMKSWAFVHFHRKSASHWLKTSLQHLSNIRLHTHSILFYRANRITHCTIFSKVRFGLVWQRKKNRIDVGGDGVFRLPQF